MILSSSLIWFLVGVVFLIAELALPGIILIFFAAGSFFAALAIWLINIEKTVQISIFLISSLILLFTLRKYSLKIFKGSIHDEIDKIYTDSKIGKSAIVTKTIYPDKAGEIKAMGSFWTAVADTEIKKGTHVLIKKQESEDGLTFKVI